MKARAGPGQPAGITVLLLRAGLVLLPLALAGCGGTPRLCDPSLRPGAAADPWGPYIRAASARYDVPQRWIRAVMKRESGGNQCLGGEPTTSSSGAAGLMQILPSTYGRLAARYGLGRDPYDPHDNIFAGTALIRELYDHYGSPGFLAAYTAGTRRMDAYLRDDRDLPDSTMDYVRAALPDLGDDPPMGGKLAAAFGGGTGGRATQLAMAPEPAPPPPPPPAASGGLIAPAYADVPVARGAWAVQVGAYPDPAQARAALAAARRSTGAALADGADAVLVVQKDGTPWYRARVRGLSAGQAHTACTELSAAGQACWAVPPGG